MTLHSSCHLLPLDINGNDYAKLSYHQNQMVICTLSQKYVTQVRIIQQFTSPYLRELLLAVAIF